MNRSLAASSLALALVLAPAFAQERDPDQPPSKPSPQETTIPMHFRVVPADDLTGHRTLAHLRSRATRERVKQMLGSHFVEDSVVDVQGDMAEGAPIGTFEIAFHVVVHGEIPDALETEILESLALSLEESLRAPLAQERSRTASTLAALGQKIEELEREYVDMRRNAAAVPREGLDTLRSIIVDLERERMQAELDLRTEEAVQQPLRDQIEALRASVAGMQTKLDETSGRRGDIAREIEDLSRALGEKMERDASAGVRARIDQLTAAMHKLDAQHERMQAEFAPLSSQLEEMQSELRRANSTVQRLTPRLRQLTEIVASQKQQILQAEEADAQRDVAEMRANSVCQRLEALRNREQDLRMQLENVEEVRIELWK